MARFCKTNEKIYFMWGCELVRLVQYRQYDNLCLIEYGKEPHDRYWIHRSNLKKINHREGALQWHAQKL